MPAVIDLRSDTVTRPSADMRKAMAGAAVGDDVYGEDPTVNRLETHMAALAGFEASLFMPSGTQSNLVALLTHCRRGDECIVGQQAHLYRFEGGGAAVVGGIQPQPLAVGADGRLDFNHVEALIKPPDIHFARTRLLCLENTQEGRALPLSYLTAARSLVDRHGLCLHLDGARLFNAAVALGVDVRTLTDPVDSASICLSKGLGAPAGSMLCGSRAFIDEARRWRKVTGGGMRQAGILAAAGLHALAHHVPRLGADHAHATRLAEGLLHKGLVPEGPYTNMVFLSLGMPRAARLADFLRLRRIIVKPAARLRLVTHLDVDAEAIDRVVDAVGVWLEQDMERDFRPAEQP